MKNNLKNDLSDKIYIIDTDMLWESCLSYYSEQLSHSIAVPIFVSLADIEVS